MNWLRGVLPGQSYWWTAAYVGAVVAIVAAVCIAGGAR